MDIVSSLVSLSTNLIENGGFIFGFLSVLIESLIPALPLNILVALNINAFGLLFGIILSLAGTIVGSYMVYIIIRLLNKKFIKKHLPKKYKRKIIKYEHKFKRISVENLMLITAIPFAPSCLINIACGICDMSKKKFLAAIIIGKTVTITFWGIVGKEFIDNLNNYKVILSLIICIIIVYILSKILCKKLDIK